ncbi:hypothetical protein A33Q_2640 [Indibacter alkaliphilus LW1]|uniref:Lipoprotein n=1 Tax=Indibacter alkaliphilus (strain CCUG 57479 / KCTC 22604 / LW1) TaxID=1189612 RepID=S2DA16_INDAL|nr:hypothetical protein [Indibacter alkaliphilus]EOZ96047.1 hypothetical protein A33Q_2640 [Indibacter alkaliphilus LW1]
MHFHKSGNIFTLLFILSTSVFFFSCEDTLESQEIVYSNDFTGLDLANFENGKLFIFRQDTLLGFYNKDEVSVTLENLPGHNVVKVEVELWIHDSWDGNPDDGISGPDIWYMQVDGQDVMRTTFSNSPCESLFCLKQSYPNNYFRQNDPKSGAIETNIPGLCIFGAFPRYTTKYRITKLIRHTASNVKITLGDELVQTNTNDPACDESWSIGKIEVTTMVVI